MLIKKLITTISIYLVIFLYSQQAFSAGFPLEFDQEFDSKIKLHSTKSGESKNLATKYLKDKKLKQGLNKRDNSKGGDFYISIGTSSIVSDNSEDDFGDARQDAFDIALLQAKKSFIKFLGQQIIGEIVSERKQGKYAQPTPADKTNMEKFLDDLDTFEEGEKIRALINVKLDEELRKAGYDDPSTPEAIQEVEKLIKTKEFNKTIEASAEHRVAGYQTKKIFENSDGKNGSITVVGIWSEKLNKLADALVLGGDVPKGTPKQSLDLQIPGMEDKDLERWSYNYGAFMTSDENGNASMIAYGHASPMFDDPDEWVDACDQAILQAESFITIFANENAGYKERLNKVRSTDIFEKNSDLSNFETKTKKIKDYYKKLSSSFYLEIAGLAPLNTVELIHPSGAFECVAAVGWSSDSRQSGEAIKEINTTAEKITKEDSETDSHEDGEGTVYEGESDDAEDF
tara:strand:- start:2391 stop:3764 length:1374 start_codon:yes stop_codon:yes gene_type:complete